MKEADFITEIVNSLKDAGCAFTYKPPDSPVSRFTHDGSGSRFTLPKPCDVITCDNNGLILIECKQQKKPGAFGIGVMQPSQIDSLTNAVKMGQRAFVFLNRRFKNPHVNECWVFEWSTLVKYWNKHGSIKKKDFERRDGVPFENVFEGHKGIFDVSILLTIEKSLGGF